MPLWSSFTLYRLETNVRSATTLGIVGAGGIGQTLVRKHPQLPVRRDGRAGHHRRRHRDGDRHAERADPQGAGLGAALMRTAKAAVYDAPNEPFVLREYPLRPARGRSAGQASRCRRSAAPTSIPIGAIGRTRTRLLGHESSARSRNRRGLDADMRGDRSRSATASRGANISSRDNYYVDVLTSRRIARRRQIRSLAVTGRPALHQEASPSTATSCPAPRILQLPDELTDEEATPVNCGVATVACVTEKAAIRDGRCGRRAGPWDCLGSTLRVGKGARRAAGDRPRHGRKPAQPRSRFGFDQRVRSVRSSREGSGE